MGLLDGRVAFITGVARGQDLAAQIRPKPSDDIVESGHRVTHIKSHTRPLGLEPAVVRPNTSHTSKHTCRLCRR